VEVKIGIRQVAKELQLDSPLSAAEVAAALDAALADQKVLVLQDAHGRQVLIPSAGIGYVELGAEHARPVGFGTI
jgi:hypothetical protein